MCFSVILKVVLEVFYIVVSNVSDTAVSYWGQSV